jgi:metal-sulfur cluster biosynthetic enzyme
VLDPEADLSLIDLGLIYAVTYTPDTRTLKVVMTLTTPACPAGGTIMDGAERRLALLADVDIVQLKLTFDPRWTPERISPEGRALLGW